jgi:hypothetical protein
MKSFSLGQSITAINHNICASHVTAAVTSKKDVGLLNDQL